MNNNLVSPNGKNYIQFIADDDKVGIWLTKGDKCICIYILDDQNCVGIYGNYPKDTAVTIGLGTSKDGEPFIQYCSKGEVKNISFDEVK